MRMTHSIAYSLGLDAANRQMRTARRRTWNEEDAEPCRIYAQPHFPLCAQLPGIEPERCGRASCLSAKPF